MTVTELRAHLKRRGLKSSGNKAELIQRALNAEKESMPTTSHSIKKQSAVVDRLKREDVPNLGYCVVDTSAEDTAKISTGVIVIGNNSRELIDAMAAVCTASAFLETSHLIKGWDYLIGTKRCEKVGLIAFGDEALELAMNLQEAWSVVIAWQISSVPKKLPTCPTLVLIEPTFLDVATQTKQLLLEQSFDCLVRVTHSLPSIELNSNFSSIEEDQSRAYSQPYSYFAVQDDPELQDETILLATAWLDLYLRPADRHRTAGPKASTLWID
uniref:SAP domain-containing protein n=1 Tax=Aureoumbra lagunensis TaxID=44058 RepID=A0A7S3K6C0_9STRA|eukprot:CAMPEP_0197296556 /NCGR_PEP_ID=MMETSP0890-20130614/38683_1 /TAXON_ID=44058 ORGANISM="Aureoumbra lagunensis, Strain CCMP1510" /NCGR_SAMPLE_ID=MMETSP0890 /ASSEMBLY_ACC=CAM_ASM_000533 /LENGTH=269 /DNA_ID=CAMNT_0042773169 /DNA_START=79 /DNA_END=888 /DNA_ORIENTATION=-